MTTARETDIMRVESKFYLLDLHRKWLMDKLGKRAGVTNGERTGNGGRGIEGNEVDIQAGGSGEDTGSNISTGY